METGLDRCGYPASNMIQIVETTSLVSQKKLRLYVSWGYGIDVDIASTVNLDSIKNWYVRIPTFYSIHTGLNGLIFSNVCVCV